MFCNVGGGSGGENYENKEKTLSISQRKEKKLRSSLFFFLKEFLLIREEM